MNLTSTLTPNSEQLNAEDLIAGPQTVTITDVRKGTSEQPVFIFTAEFPTRSYRPGKSMRRVLVSLWGAESSDYIGRKLTLFNDPSIRFGKDVTGGIRISHASHIDQTTTIALTITRGKRAPFTVEPLKVDPLIELLQSAGTLDALKAAWEQVARQGKTNLPELIQVKDARKAELLAEPGVTA